MSIKSDKTFEEIVERLTALFRPHQRDAAQPAQIHISSSESHVSDSTTAATPIPTKNRRNRAD